MLACNSQFKCIDQFFKRSLPNNEMETLITNHVKEYVFTMMIAILPGNRLLINIFGKLLYRSGPDRYRECTSTLNIWAYIAALLQILVEVLLS